MGWQKGNTSTSPEVDHVIDIVAQRRRRGGVMREREHSSEASPRRQGRPQGPKASTVPTQSSTLILAPRFLLLLALYPWTPLLLICLSASRGAWGVVPRPIQPLARLASQQAVPRLHVNTTALVSGKLGPKSWSQSHQAPCVAVSSG